MWRPRLAVVESLRRSQLSGEQMERLLGHAVLSAMVRREVLSVFSV